eukprot:7849424-Ditylum_brightwellii.AAC.1
MIVECTENMCTSSVAPGRPGYADDCANTGNCVLHQLFGNGTTALSVVSCGSGELLALDNGIDIKDSTTMGNKGDGTGECNINTRMVLESA